MVNKKMLELGSARSYIRELFEYGNMKKKELGEENVFDFSIGNPSVPSPREVEQAITKLLAEQTPVELHGYTSATGLEPTRRAIADDLNARFNAGLSAKNLFLTCGAAPALTACLVALTRGGDDEIIVIAPHFPEYRVFVESSAGATMKVVPADYEGFQINFDALESAIGPNTRAIIVNSPNNPSGVVYTESTIERLAETLTRKSREIGHDIILLSDEPYRELVYGEAEAVYIPHFYANTVICYSYSKSLSLPGERIGYVLVPSGVYDFTELMNAIVGAARAIGHVCAPSLQQKIIELCASVRPDVSVYERNARILYENLTGMGYRCAKPDGAFYMFFEAPFGMTGREFSELAKLSHNLLIVSGEGFGCPNYLRMSYCVPTRMIERALPVLGALYEEAKIQNKKEG